MKIPFWPRYCLTWFEVCSPTIITLKLFYKSVELLFNKQFELKKALRNFTFIEHSIQSSETTVVINKYYIEFATSQGWNR
jgi:hypothetical protein